MSARSLNKVMLIGNLTKDPVVRFTPSGTPVCTFGLATNREYTDSSSKVVEETDYHNVTVWSKLAEICGKILKKGMKIYIEGRLRNYSYADKETGKNVYRTEIVATDMFIVAFPKSMSGQNGSHDSGSDNSNSTDDFSDFGGEINFNDISDNPTGSDDGTKTPF